MCEKVLPRGKTKPPVTNQSLRELSTVGCVLGGGSRQQACQHLIVGDGTEVHVFRSCSVSRGSTLTCCVVLLDQSVTYVSFSVLLLLQGHPPKGLHGLKYFYSQRLCCG
jgi:hypothetical protein